MPDPNKKKLQADIARLRSKFQKARQQPGRTVSDKDIKHARKMINPFSKADLKEIEKEISAIAKEISKRGKTYNTPGERSRARKGESTRITSVIKKMYKKTKKGSPHK